MKESTRQRKRTKRWGVQVQTGKGQWQWLRPDTRLTRFPMEAAEWTGPDGELSAFEAAKTVSARVPGVTFRVARL